MGFPVPDATVLAQEASGGFGINLVLLALMFVAFYFLLIRPQRKRMQDQRKMQQSIQIGDEIQTLGGFHATIRRMDDEVITVELSPGVEARIARRAISSKVASSDVVEDDDDEELDEDEDDELTEGETVDETDETDEDEEPVETPRKERKKR